MFRKIALTAWVIGVTSVGMIGVQADDTATDTAQSNQQTATYTLVDTGQGQCYDNQVVVACPTDGAFYGQDAQYAGAQPSYTDNGDGTVTDNVTGLMWQQSADQNGDGAIDAADKLSYSNALAAADSLILAGYDDWRLPTIKELYSLIVFDGTDPSGLDSGSVTLTPFIDTRVFDFGYGDTSAGERTIDAQFASSTIYVGASNGQQLMFGVNFADGRIKGYGTGPMPGQSGDKGFYVLYVRGNAYGVNALVDNGDGSISDDATGLIWQQTDSGIGLNWQEALAYCENLEIAGSADWRLPDAKELQSIVDYSRSPSATNSAALDALFTATPITNEAGQADYAAYWSSTTHANLQGGGSAAYVNFGRSMGYMNNNWVDVHGAGAQRSDPKTGDPTAWPTGHGPQGDAIRIFNMVRCVRGGAVTFDSDGNGATSRPAMTVTASSGEASAPQGNAQSPQGNAQPNGTPPEAAIHACSNLTEGSACQFTTPQGSIAGTCMAVQAVVACVPAGGPPANQ